jgi:hypothetical protein
MGAKCTNPTYRIAVLRAAAMKPGSAGDFARDYLREYHGITIEPPSLSHLVAGGSATYYDGVAPAHD